MMIAAAAAAVANGNPAYMEQYLKSLEMKQFEGILPQGAQSQLQQSQHQQTQNHNQKVAQSLSVPSSTQHNQKMSASQSQKHSKKRNYSSLYKGPNKNSSPHFFFKKVTKI